MGPSRWCQRAKLADSRAPYSVHPTYEANGGPVAAVVRGANVHDSLLLQDALEAVIVEPPDPRVHEQHLCLDKAFSGAPSEATAEVFGYTPHFRRIGEEKLDPTTRQR